MIVNWRSAGLVRLAVASIREHEGRTLPEIIVVDIFPHDPGLAGLANEFPNVKLIDNAEKYGFAKDCNIGVKAAVGKYVFLFNSDVRLVSEILPHCLAAMELHGDSILGCVLLNPDGSVQHFPTDFPTLTRWLLESFLPLPFWDRLDVRHFSGLERGGTRMDWLTGAFIFTSKKAYLGLSGISEEFFMYCDDLDFCIRARRQGILRYCLPEAIVHDGVGSLKRTSEFSLTLTDWSRIHVTRKWRGPFRAFLLRLIFAWRSIARVFFFAAAEILTGREWKSRVRVHLHGLARLAGLRKIDIASLSRLESD